MIAHIVILYRDMVGLSLRKFANELNTVLELRGMSISHQSIKNWENNTHIPHTSMMIYLHENSIGWMQDFANDILVCKKIPGFNKYSVLVREGANETY